MPNFNLLNLTKLFPNLGAYNKYKKMTVYPSGYHGKTFNSWLYNIETVIFYVISYWDM